MCGDDDTRLRPPDQLESGRTKHSSTTSSLSKGLSLLCFNVQKLNNLFNTSRPFGK